MDIDQSSLYAQIRREHDPLKLNSVISAWENNPDRSRQLLWIEGDDEDESEISEEGEVEIDLDALRARDEYPSEMFVRASDTELEEDPVIDSDVEDEGETVEDDVQDDDDDRSDEDRHQVEQVSSRYNLRSVRQTVQPTQIPDITDRDLTVAYHDSRDKCILCQERRVFVVAQPCGHSCVCLPCWHRTRDRRVTENSGLNCLVCGVSVRRIVRL